MENSPLDSLPQSILSIILSKIVSSSLRDFGSARVAFPGFNVVGRDEHFYKTANLLSFQENAGEVNALRIFRSRCYTLGNPQAIYMRGMYEFFMLHLLDEGWQKIQLAGERGFFLASYVDGMLKLAFSVDDEGFVHNYPGFSREYVDRMSYFITRPELSGKWQYDRPGLFCSTFGRIEPNTSFECWCSKVVPWELEVSIGCSIRQRLCDRCFWQYEVWGFCKDIPFTVREWPVEDELED